MNLRNFVSSKVLEELLTRIFASLQSVTQKAPEEHVTTLIKTAVAKLGVFTFANGVELGSVVNRIADIARDNETSDSDHEAAYADARAKDAEFSTQEISTIAGRMAAALSQLIRELRNDLPPRVEELCRLIREKAEATWQDMDVRQITPANVFTWGRLSDGTYRDRAIEVCQTTARALIRDMSLVEVGPILNSLNSQLYSAEPALTNGPQVRDFVLASLPTSEWPTASALESLTSRLRASDLIGFAKAVMDPEIASGRFSLIDLTQKVTRLSHAYEELDAHLGSMDRAEYSDQIDVLTKRLAAMTVVCDLIMGAIHVYRTNTYKDVLVLPVQLSKTSAPPRGDVLYANGDALDAYRDQVKAGNAQDTSLDDVTVLYQYYFLNNTQMGASGISVARAVDLRERAYTSVTTAAEAETSAEKSAKDRATAVALAAVMTPIMEEHIAANPAMNQYLHTLHDLRMNRAQYDLGMGLLALEDQVTLYLLDMKMNPALTSLQNSVAAAMRTWSETLTDAEQIRDVSFCDALASEVSSFFVTGGLVIQKNS